MKTMATKDFRFELKETSDETGVFTGLASVYGVVDLGNDLVEAGSFVKTIKEKNEVPMLWQHKTDAPIGQIELTDTAEGLQVKGTLNLDLQQARDAYSLIKKGIIKGLSIGYRAVKSKMQNGVRHLKEIELFEISIVTFPMLPVAQISGVKTAEDRKDFTEELANAQTFAMYCLMMQALDCTLCDTRWNADMSAEEKLQESSDSIDQFKISYLAYLPMYFEAAGMKAEAKVGARHSAQTRTQIEEAIQKLQALLEGDAADTVDETAAASTPQPKAAGPLTEPEINPLHSWGNTFAERVRETLGVAN